jgi:hypothetical protein
VPGLVLELQGTGQRGQADRYAGYRSPLAPLRRARPSPRPDARQRPPAFGGLAVGIGKDMRGAAGSVWW